MKRRSFLKACAVSSVSLYAYNGFGALTGRPNLLIIQTDEHNFRTLGCYRNTLSPEQAFMWGKKATVETPNIDWIAKNGALCTKFYATTPVCSPSRSSFMSGQYPQNTPVVTNDVPMNDSVVTFASILAKNGYSTGYAGKWHLDGNGKPQWGPKRKFGFADNRYMFNRGHWKKLADTANGPKVDTGAKPSYDVNGATDKNFTTDFLADKTVEFIKENKSKPFCYMVSIPDPHGPDSVRAPYNTKYKGMKFSKPRTYDVHAASAPGWAKPQGGKFTQDQYYGMVKCIDDNVGKIMECLKENGLMKKTIVVFTSDHGDLRGEHRRHNKGVPLEASAKVPFVIYYDGKIRPGTIINESMGCVDFLPTILGLMGVKTVGREEGRDASSIFTTGKAPSGWMDITFMRGTGKQAESWVCALNKRYKLVLSGTDEPWLLDLENDPDELKNFVSDPSCKSVVKDLAQALDEYGKKYKDPRVKSAKVQSDIKWCVSGSGAYKGGSVAAGNGEKNKGPGKKGKRKKGKKKE